MAVFLITGAAGFIGGHLAEYLCGLGHEVRGYDNLSTGNRENLAACKIQLIEADITDSVAMRAALRGCDGVFHLAAVASIQAYAQDWASSSRTNLEGCLTVFEEAARANIPVVYASSTAVYGNPISLPLTENMPTQPISGYGIDKLSNELHATAMQDAIGLQATGLRFFNVYGPRQVSGSMYSGVITIFLERWLAKQPVTIFGDGSQTRDFIYVGDIVQALALAMENIATCKGAVFNICTGKSISISELVKTISECMNTEIQVELAAAKAGDVQSSSGSGTAAQKAFGFLAYTDLKKGLEQTISWISRPNKLKEN
ncbi:MAG: NAD-dependent epimerase/dehydratase family protein [Paracoccaceae bacterium]